MRRAALIGAGSTLVAALFAFLLLSEANAPERRSEVKELIIKPVAKGKKIPGKPGRKKATGRDASTTISRSGDAGSPDVSGAAGGISGATPVPGRNGGTGAGGSDPSGGNRAPNPQTDPNPVNPTGPDPDPVPEPTPDPTPDPRPIPGGPGKITAPGGPRPG